MKYNILKNIKKISFFCFISLGLALSGCVDDDLNINKHAATDDDLDKDGLRTGSFFMVMQRDVIPTSDVGANDFQRAQNLTGDIFSGYMAGTNTWNSCVNNTTYNLKFARWNDRGFAVAYTNVMSSWLEMKKYTADKPTIFSLGQIVKIASLHRITDNHGPIPYSQFGQGGGVSTPYDSQEAVYKSFFLELNEAIDELSNFADNNPQGKVMAKFDLIYGGDPVKWIKYANTLKLRLAMRIAYVEPALAKKYAEEAVSNKFGVLTDNTDNALLKSGNGTIVYNPLTVIWDAQNEARMGASMDSYMNGYKDPRLSSFFKEATIPGGGYHGVKNGMRFDDRTPFIAMSSPNVPSNTPVQWMCAAEAYFLRAEGAIRGWNMGDTPENLYNAGVRVSFEQHSASKVDEYLADNASTPTNFIDKSGTGRTTNALGTITIKWSNTDPLERKLERIITQKWIAMFPEGQEAWTEFRRTGYPKLFPVEENYSGGTINTEKQIRRIPFPESEADNNKAEVQKAIELLGNGQKDNGGTRLWWDKK